MKYELINGDVRDVLIDIDSNSVDCIITSPPYYMLRDYDNPRQIGFEQSYQEYIDELSMVFIECKRILKDTGTLFIVIGDRYSYCKGGLPSGNVMLLPYRLADSLISNGFYLRNDIIWRKPNAFPMGGKVVNKFAPSYEHVLFFTKKNTGYYFNHTDVMEDAKYCGFKNVVDLDYNTKYEGSTLYRASEHAKSTDIKTDRKKYSIAGNYKRVRRDVWDISTSGFKGVHFATFPRQLVDICMTAGCPQGGVVMDPFNGVGTTGVVAIDKGNYYIGIEINKEYYDITKSRLGE